VLNYPHPALTSYAFLKAGEGSNFQFNFFVTALGCVSKFQINSLFPRSLTCAPQRFKSPGIRPPALEDIARSAALSQIGIIDTRDFEKSGCSS